MDVTKTDGSMLFCIAGLFAAISAGLAHDVFPTIDFLPPLLGMISGILISAPMWEMFYART